MLTIQEAGKQILLDNPGKFYVFVGSEYGIKTTYLDHLSNYYGECTEVESVDTVLKLMHQKHIIPLQPQLYIVRYDESFTSGLTDKTSTYIETTNIIGTVVCIYETGRPVSKCTKYLPNYTVPFESVNAAYVKKYLIKDFPELDARYIDYAIKCRPDYDGAKNICRALSSLPASTLSSFSMEQIKAVFLSDTNVSDLNIKLGVVAKNFSYFVQSIQDYAEKDKIYYIILNALLDVDKAIHGKRIDDSLQQYANKWTQENMYNMFMNTYEELLRLRSYSTYNIDNSLIYLASLLSYSRIPSREDILCIS